MIKAFAIAAFSLFLVLGCARHPSGKKPLDLKVGSWQSMEVDELNAAIGSAAHSGAVWSRSAVGTALAALEYESDARIMELYFEGDRKEVPDTAVVIVGRDGFKDDSVRGDWHRAVLYRVADGTWRFQELRQAFRCYRGRSPDRYSADLCP